ncbi:hypothetical protein RA11412_2517 [Rothia aeria]|uniref:Uncharacterized protein n=1 Tax=Rothia aeria TaxID=172042 RepID=A0A2Z5R2X4_9MICC|nr:hypothetical protein RA11412_2517 [Rothia aeria]
MPLGDLLGGVRRCLYILSWTPPAVIRPSHRVFRVFLPCGVSSIMHNAAGRSVSAGCALAMCRYAVLGAGVFWGGCGAAR